MRNFSLSQIALIAAIALNVAVGGIGYYMYSVMSRPEAQLVIEQKYPVEVIKTELLNKGGVFDRAATLSARIAIPQPSGTSQPAVTPAPGVNSSDLGKHDLTVSE